MDFGPVCVYLYPREVAPAIQATESVIVRKGLRDADLRTALHDRVLRGHRADPDTLVLDELGLWYGTARVDIAVVNGEMHGYEIKSERDTLDRLAAQMEAYSRVLDRVTIVVGRNHLEGVARLVPPWWGIQTGSERDGSIVFEDVRESRVNTSLDPLALAAMLWCDELLDELVTCGAARGMRGKARARMAERLAGILPLDDLRLAVRSRIKLRGDWRSAAPQT